MIDCVPVFCNKFGRTETANAPRSSLSREAKVQSGTPRPVANVFVDGNLAVDNPVGTGGVTELGPRLHCDDKLSRLGAALE